MRRTGAILAALLFVGVTPAFAQKPPDDTPGANLGGYDTAGSSVAVSFQPFLPALLSTGDVPFEASLGFSTSRTKSGGNSFGRGALVWPGSTAADLGPVLGVAFGQPELGALIPKWPLQAQATQNDGEVITGAPPVATMRALGQSDKAEGDTRIADVHIPRIVHVENIASTSSSVVTDGSAANEAIVKLQGVSLLAGFIKADEIRSISRTTSIGSAASSSGDVDIIGLTIGGIDVSVTDDGFEVTGTPPDARQIPGFGGAPAPGTSPQDIVNQVLAAVGARITLFDAITDVRGSVAQRMQPGVVISVDNPVGGQGPIPPGRFDIFLASTSSSALANLPFAGGGLGGDTTGGGDEPASGDGGSISLGDGPEVAGRSVSNLGEELGDAAEGSLGAVGGLGEVVQQRSDYRFAGLPIGLVIALAAAAALLARWLRNLLAAAFIDREEPS
jgi:hypothetical protein